MRKTDDDCNRFQAALAEVPADDVAVLPGLERLRGCNGSYSSWLDALAGSWVMQGNRSALPLLETMLEDPDRGVRQVAIQATENIKTNNREPYPPF